MSYKSSVAIYLRKSRMDPEDESIEETLSRHSEALLKYALKEQLNIIAIYKEVVSGDGLFTRPEMLKLLQDIEEDKYTAVLCMAIDRLGRSSQKDGGIILETLKEHEVLIITPQKTYDLNDDIDETSVEMQTFLARQELKSIKRRLNAGIKKSLEDGYHVVEPPFGYRRKYIDKRPTLEICEEEAEVVRMIFDMYVNQGLGSFTIADKLNSMGFSPRKNDHFSRNTIRFILENPTYVGKIVWNRKHRAKKKTVHDKNKYIKNPEDKWIVSNGIHPAIIDEDTYNKAQEIRTTRSHPPSFTGRLQNPFAGLVYCKNCGTAIVRQCANKKNHVSLLCPNTGCTRSIQMHLFEREVLNSVESIFEKVKININENNNKKQDKNIEVIIYTLRQLKKELNTIETQRNSLHDLLEQGIYDTNTFIGRSKLLASKQTATELLVKQNKERLEQLRTAPDCSELIPIFEELLYNYSNLEPSQKNNLFKKLIKKITYSHDKEQKRTEFNIDIEWRFDV